MARYQLTIYPDPSAVALVGGDTPGCNQAVECWARMLDEHRPELDRQHWLLLADLLNGTHTDASWVAAYLIQEIEDAHRLDRIGEKWTPIEDADAWVFDLVGRIARMDYPTLQHVVLAVRWFWRRHEEVNLQGDEWWTPEFRVAHERE